MVSSVLYAGCAAALEAAGFAESASAVWTRMLEAATRWCAAANLTSSGQFPVMRPPSGDGGYGLDSTVWRRWLRCARCVLMMIMPHRGREFVARFDERE